MHSLIMRKIKLTLRIIISLTFIAVEVNCHSSKAKDLFIPFSELERRGHLEPVDNVSTDEEAKAISVRCTKSHMEIKIKMNLFGTDVPVRMEHFALLGKVPVEKTCRVFLSNGFYNIVAPLAECGTRLVVTEDAVIYSNIFGPSSPEGLWGTEPIAVPVTCYYRRTHNVGSEMLIPTWAPLSYTEAMEDSLDFSLKLMTDDWLHERISGIFYLGDVINVEAAVDVSNHPPLRLYVNTCVATLNPDVNSVPKYTFIENQGCLTDALQTGSSSRFLPRVRDDRLLFQLDSFMFNQMDSHPLYITCYLEAAPTEDWAPVNPQKKVCSFIDGQWRSAEGYDEMCGSCDHAKMPVREEGIMKQKEMKTINQEDWKDKAVLGPFAVHLKSAMSI